MSDTRNHTTRDQLAAVIREAVIDWNTLGTGKVGADVSTHITDALLASDAIAAVRAAAVAETTATIEAECDRLAQAADRYDQAEQWSYAGGLREAQHHVREALSGGRTTLDTMLAQAWDEGWEAAWSPMSMHNRDNGPNPYRADTGADQ